MSKYQPQKQHAPEDADVKLPAAIRAAAARSAQIHAQAYEQEQQPGQQPGQQEQQPGQQEQATNAKEEVKPEASPEVGTPSASPQSDAKAGADDFQHRYNSLKGRYDKQEDMIRQLTSRIGQLESLLARAEKAQQPAQQPTPDLQFKGISNEDREAYGDDFLDVAARAAQEKLNPEIAALKRQVAELSGKVGTVAERTEQQVMQDMYGYLDQKLPDWRALNRNPKFLAWANLPDAYSGAIRISMMRDAYSKGDAQRVLRFFTGFLADEAATDPASANKPETPTGKVSLEQFAAPGRAKAPAATVTPGEKETITRAQISQFYRDVNRGVYKGNEAEKNRLEQEIFKAEAEGRVI